MRLRLAVLPVLFAALAAPAAAGSVEDAFRGHLERLRSKGEPLRSRADVPRVTQPSMAKRVDQLPLGRNEYVVFVVPGCRSCEQAVADLKRRGMGYEVLDLSRSETAREAFALTKAKGVPAVMAGNYLINGWSEKLFEKSMVLNATDQMRGAQGQGA